MLESKSNMQSVFERGLATFLATIVTLAALAYTLDVPSDLGLNLFTEQFLALVFGISLSLAFLSGSGKRPLRLFLDFAFAALSLACALYLAVQYPVLVDELAYVPLDGLVVSLVLGGLTIEAVRRLTGWGLTAVVILFVLYGLVGHLLPFGMNRAIPWDRLVSYVVLDTNGLLGLPLNVTSVMVFSFIILGQLLLISGGGEFFNDLALALVGRRCGGVAKIAVVSSFLFGTVSGSAVANVAASGVVTIPMMKRAGYDPKVAGAVEALASTGGQLAPPIMGAAAFLMAEFLQVPYSEIVLAAIAPTILYYAAIYFFVHNYADERDLRKPPEGVEIRPVWDVIRSGWQFVVPFVVLVYTLFSLNWRPEMAACAAAATLVVLALVLPYRGRRTSIPKLLGGLPGAGKGMVEIVLISAAAGMVIGVLNITGLSFTLTLDLVNVAHSSMLLLLVVTALISLVLGMGMPTVGVYVLLASLVGPALVKSGIAPIPAHMFLMYFGMLSMITPPVALASFTAATISGAGAMETGMRAVSIGWVIYLIPFLMIVYPELVGVGSPVQTVSVVIVALAAMWLMNGAVFGFLRRRLALWERLILAIAAVIAVWPVGGHGTVGYVVNLVVLAVGFGVAYRTKAGRSEIYKLEGEKRGEA